MKQLFLEVGEIVGTHGVRGEVRVQPWCDAPEVLAALHTLYLRGQPIAANVRTHGNVALVKLDGVNTVQAAAALRGAVLSARREDIPLPAGQHFVQDLLGMDIVDADTGELYGTLCEVTQTGAHPVYHMRRGSREVLIPAVPSFIVRIDDRIHLRPLEGLFDAD